MLTALLLAVLAQTETPTDSVRVHIESDTPGVQLFRHLGTDFGTVASGRGSATLVVNRFNRECSAPCDARIQRPDDDFYIAGNGITSSSPFNLLDHGQSVTLRVKAGRAWQRWAGATLTTLGAASVITGGLFVLLGVLSGPKVSTVPNPYGSGSGGSSSIFQTMGIGLLAGGGAALAVGIPLIAFSGTDVEFLPGLDGRSAHGAQEI